MHELTLKKAQVIVTKAVEKAEDIGVPVAIVVVDDAGNLKAFARMDGVYLAATRVATAKAYTSAAYQAPTSGLRQFVESDKVLAETFLALPDFLPLDGGIPITQGSQVIGAIGVSGGHYTQDVEIATAGLS